MNTQCTSDNSMIGRTARLLQAICAEVHSGDDSLGATHIDLDGALMDELFTVTSFMRKEADKQWEYSLKVKHRSWKTDMIIKFPWHVSSKRSEGLFWHAGGFLIWQTSWYSFETECTILDWCKMMATSTLYRND